MKNTRNIFFVALLTLVGVTMSGCKDKFFDHSPEDALTLDSYYQNADQVRASTNALYNSPWFNFNNKAFWAITELSGGNARTYSGDVVNFANFSVTADNNELTNAWRSLFSVVAQSNALINNLPAKVPSSVDPAVVNNALGEAHFMRAMAYFYLVRLFGNVPIIENTLDFVYSPKINTNPVTDVYTFIIRDLEFAEANCTPKIRVGSSISNGHVSSGSASAVLSKVYLYKQDYAKARQYAEKVINSGEFKLYGTQVVGKTFTDLFRTANNNNEETIAALQWVGGSAYGHGNSLQASFAISSQITGTGDGYSVIGPTIDLQNEFAKEPGDVRRQATIMLADDKYPELNAAGGGYTVPADVNAQNTRAGIKKYVVGTRADNGGLGAAQSAGNNTYLMRYAEVLLIEAEAVLGGAASTSDPAALTAFNQVRTRAGLVPKTVITQADILRERRLELAIEGENLQKTKAVYFNDVSVYFNPAFVTSTSIMVAIPVTTPFSGSNKVRVETTSGQTEFGFSIKQPFATITNVDQLAGNAGDIITITGTIFDNVSAVRFGTANAEITAKTPTELKVKVPTGVTSTTLTVTTPGGTTAYGVPFGFKYSLFEDALIPGWTAAGYNGKPTVPSKEQVKRGTASMQYDYTGGFGGFQNFLGGTPIVLSNYTGIKLALYGGTGTDGKIIKMVINGNYDKGKQLVLKSGVWQTFAIPLSDLGATTGNLTEVTFQEFSGNVPETIYIDDMGLY